MASIGVVASSQKTSRPVAVPKVTMPQTTFTHPGGSSPGPGNFPDVVDENTHYVNSASQMNLLDNEQNVDTDTHSRRTSNPNPSGSHDSPQSYYTTSDLGPPRNPGSVTLTHTTQLVPSSFRTVPHISCISSSDTSGDTHGQMFQQPTDGRLIQTQNVGSGIVLSYLNSTRTNALPDLLAHSRIIQPHSQTSLHPVAQIPPVIPTSQVTQLHRTSNWEHGVHSRSGHSGRSRRHSRRHSHDRRHTCKDSCCKCVAALTAFRWILVVLSLLGVCCVVTGIVLAALHAAGNSFLFLAIMFIGLGVLLVVVVGVGWKCTPRGHEPLHALFGIGEFRRRQHSRHRGHRGRNGQWHGGVLYPEFQYRRPPPTYSASMQEYQHQLMLAQQRHESGFYDPDNLPVEDYSLPSSPPPSYRSHSSTLRTGIRITFPPNNEHPNSRPPTYRSHISTLGHSHPRPSLPREEVDSVDPIAPSDVAFTGPVDVEADNANNQNTDDVFVDNQTSVHGDESPATTSHTVVISIDHSRNTSHLAGPSSATSSLTETSGGRATSLLTETSGGRATSSLTETSGGRDNQPNIDREDHWREQTAL
ncbi:hypothetical protein CHS0354_008028 [Potamilus streckersoni]|uniref:Uncharacterized protein n=1 Tax=Potamilus streckersoni TaxID=2493646 RepID=A0AAE0RLK6_9BIVA|nr:hypothetical protein CHS0354_008028 [Potamilus streckersoni]